MGFRYLVRDSINAAGRGAATKVKDGVSRKVASYRPDVAICDHCGKPITGVRHGKATHHQRCAKAAAQGF